jgi:hypothetical protein
MKRRWTAGLLCALLALTQPACYLTRDALRQERSRLQMELDALQNLERDLGSPGFPGARHVELKLGFDVINQVLAGADGVEVPLPQQRDAFLRIHEIRFTGQDATPLLTVRASAKKYGVTVDAAVTAMLVLDQPDPAQPPVFRVRIHDIAPVVTWRQFTLRRLELARKVLVTKADQLAVNNIAFPIPMEHALRLDIPAVAQEARVETRNNGSYIRYRISKPPSTLNRVVRIDRVVFLSDGIHLYATIA